MNRIMLWFCKGLYSNCSPSITKNYGKVKNHINLKLPTSSFFVKTPALYSTQDHRIATFEEVKKFCSDKCNDNVLLIDVREPEELCESGIIPSSINIPLGNLEMVLKDMTNEEFLKIFGREKPHENSPIIFSCRLGKRSAMACDISQKLGYKNVKNYIGGWLDWEERSKCK